MRELTQLLHEASAEIQTLRRRNEILSAKVEVFDSLMCLFHTRPVQNLQIGSPDLVYKLQSQISQIQKEEQERDYARVNDLQARFQELQKEKIEAGCASGGKTPIQEEVWPAGW